MKRLHTPGNSVDGLAIRVIRKSPVTSLLTVELLEERPQPDGSKGWRKGDRLQVEPYEVKDDGQTD